MAKTKEELKAEFAAGFSDLKSSLANIKVLSQILRQTLTGLSLAQNHKVD